jgi:signal peptidase
MEDYYQEKIKNKQKKKILQSIIIKVIYIILLPIIIWDLCIVIQTIHNPYKTPSVFGLKTFCIISGSMEPNISKNDVVIIKEVEQNEINKGDIISFNINGETITHRVINISSNSEGDLLYTTQGDANNIEDDEKITFEDIEGKYIGRIPKIGKIILALKSKFTLCIVLAVLIFLYFIEQKSSDKKIKRSNKRKEYEKNKDI